jgi:hypothetical protein
LFCCFEGLDPIVLQNPATDFVFTTTCIASEKQAIRRKRESPIRVPETQSTFIRVQRNAFRRRDVRRQSSGEG